MRSLIAMLVAVAVGGALAQSTTGIGGWWVFEDIDPVTDENFSFLTSLPLEVIEGQEGANLQVRCQPAAPRGLEVLLFVERSVGEAPVAVDLRLDGGGPDRGDWLPSASGKALTLDPDRIPTFLARVSEASEATFDVPFAAADQRFAFRVERLQGALDALDCYRP